MNKENITQLRDFIAGGSHPWNMAWVTNCYIGQAWAMGKAGGFEEFLGIDAKSVNELAAPENFMFGSHYYPRERAIAQLDHLLKTGKVDWAATPIAFAGFHKFRADDGSEYGSFEVFEATHSHDTLEPGWYWWPCQSGCLPDGEPNGPFPESEGAYLHALEGDHG